MFKKYRYETLSNNSGDKLVIPGMDDVTVKKDKEKSFIEQITDIAKNIHGRTYEQLYKLSKSDNEMELLYRIINFDPKIKYKFRVNHFDNLFGSFNRLHEFIHESVVKVSKSEKVIKLSLMKSDVFLETNLDCSSEGYILDVHYKATFDDTVMLRINNLDLRFSGKFVMVKDKIFLTSIYTKVVSNEKYFLLEIFNNTEN
ncbi:ORF-62 [Teiidae poxvirus 1]|nr:ORF-62 [Teiidae poxvirus 1]